MIDIKFLRENPDAVKENIKKKFQDAKLPLVDEVIALDAESRKTQQEADELHKYILHRVRLVGRRGLHYPHAKAYEAAHSRGYHGYEHGGACAP